jgi:hypothetical protein
VLDFTLDFLMITLQIIQVNQTDPCFMNFTAGAEVWLNCGMTTDYLSFMLLPWEWITGGNFSLIIVSLFIVFSYIKYHRAIYPIIIGMMFLPIAGFLFPDIFLSYAFLIWGVCIAGFIIFIILKQTKEY